MKRIFMTLCAALLLLPVMAQTQVKVTANDGNSVILPDFQAIYIDNSEKNLKIYATKDTTLRFDQLKSIGFMRDNQPWNLQWKMDGTNIARHYAFGYGAIMHVRDVMTDDVMRPDGGYNWFSSWAKNAYQGKGYVYSDYVWGYLRDMVIEANQWIAACQGHEQLKGLLGAAYASRAMLYLDMARMYEFLPNDRTTGLSASGQDVTGLTVPIIDEDTPFDAQMGYYNAPRATREAMAAFILGDLDKAEALLPSLSVDGSLLPHLDAAYGLKARLFMWTGDYAKAQQYAAKAIEAASTKPMTREEMLSTVKGFNDGSKWMWSVQYLPEEYYSAGGGGLVNWASWMSNEDPYSYTQYAPLYIDRHLYDRIPTGDVRKRLWMAPEGSSLDGQVALIDANMFPLEAYASVKFRPNEGNIVDDKVADCLAFPLMRVEEMYFIEAEAAAQQGNVAAATQLLNKFMQENRNTEYNCTLSDQQALVDEIVLQKRIELWGEGQTFFDVKRLNLSVTRDYDGTNFPEESRFNTAGRPAWMNMVFPFSEEQRNASLTDMNNPDPSGVYAADYSPADADAVLASIHGDVRLETPAFVNKIDVLPLDSVYTLLFSYQLPEHGADVLFDSRFELSLSADFPREGTKMLSSVTDDDGSQRFSINARNMSGCIAYLLKQKGAAASGETSVFVRVKACVQNVPTIQMVSDVVSFRVNVSETPTYYRGYSYAPRLTVSSAGVLDMERLAGLDSYKACNLNVIGEGSASNASDYPFRLNLNLWGLGFSVDSQGYSADYPDFVSLYKYNVGNNYPGKQDFQATVTCYMERDGLQFYCMSEPFDQSVIINRQEWEEFGYSWRNLHSDEMRSEAMPEVTTVEWDADTNANMYRLREPYAKGHNLMISVYDDGTATMSRQYAYNDAMGEPVYASGTGTFDGSAFDMQVTFSNVNSTQTTTCHEVYGTKWEATYQGNFKTSLWNEYIPGVIYVNANDRKQHLLKPFVANEEGLKFVVEDDGRISFDDTSTGYYHSKYGLITGVQYDTDDQYSHVDRDGDAVTFHFCIRYTVTAGYFGIYDEVFETTAPASVR